jgi:hypothetical protein
MARRKLFRLPSGGISGLFKLVAVLAAAAAAAAASGLSAGPARAATVDHYQVQLAAWIPQASVTGPQPSNKCFGYSTTLATYNGNNHVGFDGEYKATVTYDFTYDGSNWADVSVTTKYGPTYAEDGICTYHGQATSAAGVTATASGVTMSIKSANPIVFGAPPIIANIDLSFTGTSEMNVVDHSNRFPSHGFRIWKNGQVIATAVDYDVSCENVTGYTGAANIAKQLATGADVITHHVDLRVPGQSYFGTCGKTAPAPLSYPAPAPPSVPTPVPGNQPPAAAFTSSRLSGPGNQVRLDASGSSDPDGSIAAYQWSSGGENLGTGEIVVAALGTAASAPVTLKVTDNRGAVSTLTRTLSLPDRPPVITGVTPASGATYPNIQPVLSATARDDDADPLQYSYRLTGNGVDLSSGWVSGQWQVPPHSIDPGLSYSWTVTVQDGRGGTASRTSVLQVAALPTAKRLVAMSTGAGYWQVASDGGVFSYGAAPFYGSLPGLGIHVSDIIGMARTPDDGGYWLVGSDGGVFAFGDAPYLGSLPGLGIHVGNIVGMAPTKSGSGYWLVGSDGGVFAFGDAGFYGSMGGKPLNAPVVSMAATPSGNGYWLAAADGGVFAFGDAPFYGSMAGQSLNAPVVDIQLTPSGKGYWLAAADGGVFAFGDAPFYGSVAGQPLNGRIDSMAPTPTGHGYWLNACDGGVFAFGDAPFYGSNPVDGCRGN